MKQKKPYKVEFTATISYTIEIDPEEYVKCPTPKQTIKQEKRELRYDIESSSWDRNKFKYLEFNSKILE